MIGFFAILGFSQMRWFEFKHVEAAIIATVLLLTALYAFVETGERIGILIGAIFTTVVLGVVVNYYFHLGMMSYILRSGKWIRAYANGTETYITGYAIVITVLLLSVEFIVLEGIKAVPYGREFLCVVAFGGIVAAGFYHVLFPKTLLAAVFAYTIYTFSSRIHQVVYKKKEKQKAAFYLLPFFLVCVVLTCALPVKEQPLSWKWVTDIYYYAVFSVEDMIADIQDRIHGDDNVFSFGDMRNNGGEDVKLGGSIKQTNTTLLQVEKSRLSRSTTYIYGGILDEYTGQGWKKNAVDIVEDEKPIDTEVKEMLFGLANADYQPAENEILLQNLNLHIKFNRLRSKTVFYPQYGWTFTYKDIREKVDDNTSNILFRHSKKSGYDYRSFYFELNNQSMLVQDYLRSLQSFSYKDTPKINPTNKVFLIACGSARQKDTFINQEFYEKMYQRELKIKDAYTKLPDSVPERVYQLAQEITKDEDNPYDKLICIKDYLRKMPYTLKVPEVPEHVDFTDHFLFDTKKGYCTYFATAMAVLSRCINIPTRYCEGFVVEYEKDKVDDYYQLSSKSAHAWCEAYIAGYGWIRMEATPGYGVTKVRPWTKTDYVNNHYNFKPETPEPSTDELSQLEQQELMKSKTTVASGILIGVIAFLLILLVGLMAFYLRYRKNTRFRKKNRDQVNDAFKEMLYYLKLFGYQREPGETVYQFQKRIPKGEDHKYGDCIDSWDVFLKARYSEEEITEVELQRILKDLASLKEVYLEQKGRIRYGFSRITYMVRIGARS